MRHFIIFVIIAAALGVATVWHEVCLCTVGYEMETLTEKIQELNKDIDNANVEMLQLTRKENLEALNRKYDLRLAPPG